MPKIETTVESFELDHDSVRAPYVRLISREEGRLGDIISNFDVRLSQPNVSNLDPSSIHTIEHCLAGLIRDRMDGLIDISPFGCLTGFHAIFWGKVEAEKVAKVVTDSLIALLEFSESDVPGMSRKQCGAYKMHSLFGAKEWAKKVLDERIVTDYLTTCDIAE
jgi:S-ribosylhomocysteine lyase